MTRLITAISTLIVSAVVLMGGSVCPDDLVAALNHHHLFERLVVCGLDKYFRDPDTCVQQLPVSAKSKLRMAEILCQSCYSQFTSTIAAIDSERKPELMQSCGRAPLSEACLASSEIRAAATDFQACSGYSVTYPSCSPESVRARAKAGDISTIIQAVIDGADDPTNITSSCDYCYNQFFSDAVTNLPDITSAVSSCTDLPFPTNCTAGIPDILDRFAQCSGYSLDWFGAECRLDQILSIEAQLSPYETLTGCAFHPDNSSCSRIGEYLTSIGTISSSRCQSCYSEYYSDLSRNTATVEVGSVCQNVWDDACMTWNSEPMEVFSRCSGGAIIIPP